MKDPNSTYDSVKYPAALPEQCAECGRFFECTTCWQQRLMNTPIPQDIFKRRNDGRHSK